jgi:hypothetical protein
MDNDFNGMTGNEQPSIPLRCFDIKIKTSAAVVMTDELRQTIANAVWRCLPAAEDGDVEIMDIPPPRRTAMSDVVVTQADREAALSLIGGVWDDADRVAIRAGQRDTLSVIRAFARHRMDATRDLLEALEEISGLVLRAFDGELVAPHALDAIDDVAKAHLAKARSTTPDTPSQGEGL